MKKRIPVWKETVRLCEVCGAEYYPAARNQKYCSKKCSYGTLCSSQVNEWKESERFCAICGDGYYPNSYNQKYCSPECAQKHQDVSQLRGRFVVFHRDEFCCIYCGRSPVVDKDIILHLEHVVPKRSGGENNMSNLVTSCAQCNIEKGHEPLSESAQYKILSEIERRNKASGFEPYIIIKVNE